MKVVKIAAGVACGLIILLLVLIFTVRNPETALYEETVEMLMKQEGSSSHREIEESFPILVEIQADMSRIAKLKQVVLVKTLGPATMINKEETLQLKDYHQTIRQLRKVVRKELLRLIADRVQEGP